MNNEKPEPGSASWWALLIEVAHSVVKDAQAGANPGAAKEVLRMARVTLVGLLDQGALPSPEGVVYLRALADALMAIESGAEPAQALGIVRPGGGIAHADTETIRALLFVQVGEELDSAAEETVRPTQAAFKVVAQRNHNEYSSCSAEKVRKAWQAYGSTKGWEAHKAGIWPPAELVYDGRQAESLCKAVALWGRLQ